MLILLKPWENKPINRWRCCNISNYHGYKPESKIFLVSTIVDFRKSVGGLTAIIQEELNLSPMENACFIFCNSQRNKIKIIEWDYNGFWLYYKRLDSGKFNWPHSNQQILPISRDQYDWLMNGLSIHQRDGFKEVLARKVIWKKYKKSSEILIKTVF